MAPDDVVTTVVYSRACTMLLSHLMFFAQFPDPALRFLLLAVWESCCRLHKVVAAIGAVVTAIGTVVTAATGVKIF